MVVVTAVAPGAGGTERSGCLVGFTTQCAIDPARSLVCLSVNNHTYRVALRSTALGVHGLAAGQHDLASLFGSATDDTVDKFARCDWRTGPAGVPLLTGCPRWFVGEIVDRVEFGDHVGFVLDPIEAAGDGSVPPLMFSEVTDLTPGHPA